MTYLGDLDGESVAIKVLNPYKPEVIFHWTKLAVVASSQASYIYADDGMMQCRRPLKAGDNAMLAVVFIPNALTMLPCAAAASSD